MLKQNEVSWPCNISNTKNVKTKWKNVTLYYIKYRKCENKNEKGDTALY